MPAQNKDIRLKFGDSPQCQHRPDPYHGLRWRHRLLTPGCSSLPWRLQFCLSLLFTHPSVSLSLPFPHHLFAPLSSTPGLWMSGVSQEYYALPCHVALSKAVSGMICPSGSVWHRAGGHLSCDLLPSPPPATWCQTRGCLRLAPHLGCMPLDSYILIAKSLHFFSPPLSFFLVCF